MVSLFADPFVSFDTIDRDELNECLVRWGHRMGPLNRPAYTKPIDFALRRHGKPVAVIASDTLIRDTCGFDRSAAFELSRLCGPEHGMCADAMWMWRHFAYPIISHAWRTPWVISYQDATQHKGFLYRYDNWVVIGYSVSGRDPRAQPGTASVRRKVIWGWNADAAAMAEKRRNPPDKPKWAERIAA